MASQACTCLEVRIKSAVHMCPISWQPNIYILSGARGLGRLSGRLDGCAGRVCQVRGRAVPSGARRGPGWPCVESAADAPFPCPCVFIFLFLSVSSLFSSFKQLR